MTEIKKDTGSDLEKVDAYTVTSEQYREIPELTDDWFERAELHVAGRKVPRGRPPSPTRKQPPQAPPRSRDHRRLSRHRTRMANPHERPPGKSSVPRHRQDAAKLVTGKKAELVSAKKTAANDKRRAGRRAARKVTRPKRRRA
jgi:hypothetical protein